MGADLNGTSVTHATPGGIPAGHGDAGWRSWAVGTRVVVRRRLPAGGWSDVLGDVLEVGPDGLVVRTRRGPVRVPAADIALGKPVPPAPPRRAPREAIRDAPGPVGPPGPRAAGPAPDADDARG